MTQRHRVSFLVYCLLMLCIPLTASSVEKERRIALVIGINHYENAARLTNPTNDARAIGDSLRRLNFDVMESYDADYSALSGAIRAFGVRAASADVAVVYYAGHGVQADRENYMVPSDAKLDRDRDLLYETIPVERLLGEVSQAARIGIMLLDSCRNNPFTERVARSMSVAGRAVATKPGLARVDNVPRNTMVVMAAKADQIAEDGQEHSPFAAAILAHLQIPGLELGLFFRSVRDTVLKATANRQEPYVFSSLGAEPFYFRPLPPNRPPVIDQIPTLQVLDNAGPMPLGIPRPTDPDQDPLTVRIIGLPRSGEVRVGARVAISGEVFALDRFMMGTFKADGKMLGPIGTLDILVEDGRGGSVTGSLPIVVLSSNHRSGGETSRTDPATPENLASASLGQIPPVSVSAPSTPVGLTEARTLALGLPCALIDVQKGLSPNEPGSLRVSGPALPGAAFDDFLRQLSASGRAVAVASDRLDPGHCSPLAVITDLVRRSRERGALRLRVPDSPIPVGDQLAVTAQTLQDGALYIDLFAADGSVHHLRRGTVPRGLGGTNVAIAAPISGAPGQRLLVAIATSVPLDLMRRPPSESETAYLPALQRELNRAATGTSESRAELATLSVIAAGRPVASPPLPRTAAAPSNSPCPSIVERVQLGETLSDADLAILRTTCGH